MYGKMYETTIETTGRGRCAGSDWCRIAQLSQWALENLRYPEITS
jgi:hypothetical protein